MQSFHWIFPNEFEKKRNQQPSHTCDVNRYTSPEDRLLNNLSASPSWSSSDLIRDWETSCHANYKNKQ